MPADNKKAFLNFAVALTSGWAAQQTRHLLYSCNTFRAIFVSGLYGMYRYGADAEHIEFMDYLDFFVQECAFGMLAAEICYRHGLPKELCWLNLAAGITPLLVRLADKHNDDNFKKLLDMFLFISVGTLLYITICDGRPGQDWISALAVVGLMRARALDKLESEYELPKLETSYGLLCLMSYCGVRAIMGPLFDFFNLF